jgi:hypothetical protein
MSRVTDIIANLQAVDENLKELAATIDASKDPAAAVHKIGIAEAYIGDLLAVIGDVRNRAGSWGQDLIDDLNWAERDLQHALRSLGNARATLAALLETRQ